MRGRWLALLALLGGLHLPVFSQPAQPTIALVGGTLIDGTGAAPRKDVTIVIEAGRIQTIGERKKIKPLAGTQLIQTKDKFIIPGLIDVHVHYKGPWQHRLYLANGVTTVRDMGTLTETITALRQEIQEGKVLAPRLFVSGEPVHPMSIQALQLENAAQMAEHLIQNAVDGIKVTGYTVEDLEEIVAVAQQKGLRIYGHTAVQWGNETPGARRAIEGGLNGIEHALGILEDAVTQEPNLPVQYDATKIDHVFRYWYGRMHEAVDRGQLESLVQLMVNRKVYFAPTLVHFDRSFVRRGTLALEGDPALRFIPRMEPTPFRPFGPDVRNDWAQTLALMKEATFQFFQAGGLLGAGTDSPGAALPGWSIHQEMALFVEAGLSPMEAIQAATLNNAIILQTEDEVGTIQVGKWADLVILDEDPLKEIHHTRNISAVIKEGTLLHPAQLLQDQLDELRKQGARGYFGGSRR